MARDSTSWIYALSLLVHGALGLAVIRVEPRAMTVSKPVYVVIESPPPEPPVVKDDEPEPEPEPEPESPNEAQPLEAPAPAVESPPEPKPARPRADPPRTAEPSPSASTDVPDFGFAMEGGPGGVAVPEGDPSGRPREGGSRPEKVVKKARALDSETKPKSDDGCSEAATKPKPVSMPQPTYTDKARAAGVEGVVRVELTVAADGRVTSARVLRSLDPDLDEAAKRAVEAAQFTPANRCGKPVEATFTVSVRFSL